MRSLMSGVFALLLCGLVLAEDNPEPKFDASKLTGTWTYTKGTRAGTKVAKERLAGDVVVTKETFTIPGGPDAKFVMAYKIDGSKMPAQIDLEIKSGPVSEGKAQGIIQVKGDTFTICYMPSPGKRPTKFESTEDNGAFMFTLKRKKK